MLTIIKFDDTAYLAGGNPTQQQVYELLTRHEIMQALHSYQPLLVGTVPIAISIDSSDLDIICCYADAAQFEDHLIQTFGYYTSFKSYQTNINHEETVVATFSIDNWAFEIFGQNIPTKQQNGYRHMIAEYKLLQKHGEAFTQQIISLKQQGLKTEPAFAKALGIKGDPYLEILKFC
jgi:hypothetical protein